MKLSSKPPKLAPPKSKLQLKKKETAEGNFNDYYKDRKIA